LSRAGIEKTRESINMIRQAAAVRFDRLADSGRNLPLRVGVETSDSQEHEVFLKASGRPGLGVEGLANEAVAACLAADLGLPINEPFLVELDEAWIESIPDDPTKQMLRASERVAFASKSAGPQWKIWSDVDDLNADRRSMALAVLAFDAYIANDDRRMGNSNCLVKGNEFRIIDHELVFRIRQKLFPRAEPWKAGNLERLVQPEGHIFGAKLKGRTPDFAPVLRVWCDLSDVRLQNYLSTLPNEWASAMDAMEQAVAHIRNVRDRIDDCIAELQRALT
jgi:hypothetical protein